MLRIPVLALLLACYAPAGNCAALFNGMVAPAVGYTIKGVIWYQGESNSRLAFAPMYARIFPALIDDWRAQWHEGNFPFLFVQISSFKSDATEAWAVIREAQRRTLSVANTAMVVTADVGNPDNDHPADKQTVGARLALAARALAHGENVECRLRPSHRKRNSAQKPTQAGMPVPQCLCMEKQCTHLNQIRVTSTRTHVCEDCARTGDSWVHLRMCLICGHVGCCDSSKNKHATKHFHSTKHPLMRSIEQGEDWVWCYEDGFAPAPPEPMPMIG